MRNREIFLGLAWGKMHFENLFFKAVLWHSFELSIYITVVKRTLTKISTQLCKLPHTQKWNISSTESICCLWELCPYCAWFSWCAWLCVMFIFTSQAWMLLLNLGSAKRLTLYLNDAVLTLKAKPKSNWLLIYLCHSTDTWKTQNIWVAFEVQSLLLECVIGAVVLCWFMMFPGRFRWFSCLNANSLILEVVLQII